MHIANPIQFKFNNPTGWIAILFAVTIPLMVVFRYVYLHSNIFDLGLYLNALHNVPENWRLIFYGHFQPLLVPYGFIYSIFPELLAPAALVLSQSLVILSSIWAIWHFFGRWAGIALLLYYPVWVNALFDFHLDHLAIPLLAIFFIASCKERYGLAALTALSLMLIKEPFALQTAACGIYFWWLAYSLKDKSPSLHLIILGAFLFFGGSIWFYVATQWVVPYFTGADNLLGLASTSFGWLGDTPLNAMTSLINHPSVLIEELINSPQKIILLGVIFGLLGFIPLLRPASLIVAAPLILIPLLSHSKDHYDYANHYMAGVIIPVIVAFKDGLLIAKKWFKQHVEINGRLFSTLLIMWLLFSHWYISPSPISRLFWSQKVWSLTWEAYALSKRVDMIKMALLTHIPAGNAVSISSQNNLNWGYLANRENFFSFPLGIEFPQKTRDFSKHSFEGLWNYIRFGISAPNLSRNVYADYVVIDLKRPLFLIDQGCDWVYGRCRNDEVHTQFLERVNYCDTHYETIFSQDGFKIYKRHSLEGI